MTTTLPAAHRLTLGSVFARTLADRWLPTVLSGVGLFLMGLMLGPLYSAMAEQMAELASAFPPAMTAVFGDFTTEAGFVNVEMYSMMAPGLVAYVALDSITHSLGAGQERHRVGLLLANPVGRLPVALQQFVAMMLQVLVVAALAGVGVWVGAMSAAGDLALSGLIAVTIHLVLFGWFAGALGLLAATGLGRKVPAMVAAAVVVLVCYAWGSFVPLSESLSGTAVFSPWDWYYGVDPLQQGVQLGAAGLLAGVTVLITAVGLWWFNRRDLAG